MKANVPAGFQTIDEKEFARTHDFRVDGSLQGTVGETRVVPQGSRRTKVMEVQKEDGEKVSVWENQMLNKLFAQARKGDQIYVECEYEESGDENKRARVSGYVVAIKKAKAK